MRLAFGGRMKLLNSLVCAFVVSFAAGCSSAPGSSPASVGDPDPLVAIGGARATACVNCHGADLSGSAATLPGTSIYAPNLTPDVATGLGSWSDDDVANAMRAGVDNEGHVLCSAMPRFDTLSDSAARELVAYLRSIPAVSHAPHEGACEASPDAATPEGDPCDGLADPSTPARCDACLGQGCAPNGCRASYWCDTRDRACVPRPYGC